MSRTATSGLMISYQDAQSLALQAKYAREKQLAGVVTSELSEDDAQGSLLHAFHSDYNPRAHDTGR